MTTRNLCAHGLPIAACPSASALDTYMSGFDAEEIPKLRKEARTFPVLGQTPANVTAAVHEAITNPSLRTVKNIRNYTDRELARALGNLNHQQQKETA